MTTVTALFVSGIIYGVMIVPIYDGVREITYVLQPGQSFQVSTTVWNQQVIARQMLLDGLISAV